ncbi:B-cell antigen receptor complex-associated protein beta chain isoform X1 [Cricetulus griseus]|uniref:B-cell antigen receptor complex-associated protein beta chain n=1 Tax=Cricetulus griseus TaxID=10029 RepID=A0A8C2MVE6_CRIGR|nr:B-cell antigen receptor complex-associated protein beta chain isoform X1 [Cricetulus griseus]XP_027283617.1 B-cell antigen receptor complex-associated protein beta chain isoform X1 [Cricetulus griseus]
MATMVPSSVPCHWLLFLLLLFSGEPVPAMTNSDLPQNFQGSSCSKILQFPRYVAKKRNSVVKLYCSSEYSGIMTWFRKQGNQELQELSEEEGHISKTWNGSLHTLTIRSIQYEDNGIYFCKQQCNSANLEIAWGCGSELKVLGFSTLEQLKRRNTLKDGIIMIQTLLIIVFIIVPIFLLLDKDDSKAGMEEDHTYEGLNIDQTATYEDIVTLRTGEVKWSVGEHPGQE